MDLGFSFKDVGDSTRSGVAMETRLPDWIALLARVGGAADKEPAAGPHLADLRGQINRSGPVHALVRLFAPENGGVIETASLDGSFNPAVARHLMVGAKMVKGAFTLAL
jgi:hypothetical protein